MATSLKRGCPGCWRQHDVRLRPPPDAGLGVAVRLAGYLDCQARVLGENGFQAMAGGPVAGGLLSGLVTIFVALIGYRFILGGLPSVRDGVGWAVRLGIALTLATGWPAFQVLVYRVAVDAPGEVAAALLPAAGMQPNGLDERVQAAYDTLRLGSAPQDAQTTDQSAAANPRSSIGQFALPQTGMILVIGTVGVTGALRVAVGLLLALGPLAALALLFDATLGLFSGWVRALGGAALALVGAAIVTALDLVAVESELARLQVYTGGGIAEVVDPQALTTIVLLFAVVMLVVVLLAMRMVGAFQLPLPRIWPAESRAPIPEWVQAPVSRPATALRQPTEDVTAPSRAGAVAGALEASRRREQLVAMAISAPDAAGVSQRTAIVRPSVDPTYAPAPIGVAGRRFLPRRTRTAARRDSVA